MVINVNGIHKVNLDFCGCNHAQTHYKQLLQSQWFPATTFGPHTAAMFTVLKGFYLLSLESKASVFEFYSSLVHLSDNMDLIEVRDHYPAFLHMMCKYRHLKQLMHAGRGHDPQGIKSTQEGECVVKCPACPHLGINLPFSWESMKPTEGWVTTCASLSYTYSSLTTCRWVYALFIAIDTNFCLKRKTASSNQADLGLNRSWAYFVEEGSYKDYLAQHASIPQEVSG